MVHLMHACGTWLCALMVLFEQVQDCCGRRGLDPGESDWAFQDFPGLVSSRWRFPKRGVPPVIIH